MSVCNTKDGKMDIYEVVCILENKINELVEVYNKVIENQEKLNATNEQLKSMYEGWQGEQLAFLQGVVLKSPNNTLYTVEVDDLGNLSTTLKVQLKPDINKGGN